MNQMGLWQTQPDLLRRSRNHQASTSEVLPSKLALPYCDSWELPGSSACALSLCWLLRPTRKGRHPQK